MQVQTHTREVPLVVTSTLEYVTVNKTLAVCKQTKLVKAQAESPSAFAKSLEGTSEVQLIATLASVSRHMKTGKPLVGPKLSEGAFSVVSKDFRRVLAQEGFPCAVEQDSKTFPYQGRPFDAMVSGDPTEQELLHINYSTHQVFDAEGAILPAAMPFDYLNGLITSQRYDLDKALAILVANPRVRFVSPNRRDADKAAMPRVHDLPYFAESSGQQLCFNFEPSVQEMRDMWAWQQAQRSQYPSTLRYESVFYLDILGLRKGGAARFEDYYGSQEESSEDDED